MLLCISCAALEEKKKNAWFDVVCDKELCCEPMFTLVFVCLSIRNENKMEEKLVRCIGT